MTYVQEVKTIRNILKSAITVLKKSNIEFPEINADTLLAHVLYCDRTSLYTNPEKIINDADILKYKELIKIRASHVPLQYITQRVEFMSLVFVVDKRVLIPRPETEILVEEVLNKAKSNEFSEKNIVILEIGTGSGNIAVSLAKYLSNVEIYTNDISQDALTVADINVHKHEVAEKVNLLNGDFFEVFCKRVEKKNVDFIVSNPPYVSKSELNSLEPELREHEPYQALVGGEDGLSCLRKIIKESGDWLRSGGYLVIEIGEKQAKNIIKLLETEKHYTKIKVIKDLQGIKRVISACRI